MEPQRLARAGAKVSRRSVLTGWAIGAAGAVLGRAAPRGRMGAAAIGTGWTHLGGGGGSLLCYNADSGAGLSGTLDGAGFTPVQEYSDFSPGYQVLVGTPAGSLLLEPLSGLGAAGTLADDSWAFLNEYHDFAPWTHAAAASDSVLLYNRSSGLGAGGTLRDGAWSYDNRYDDFAAFSHVASAGNGYVLFYDTDSGLAAWGTLAGASARLGSDPGLAPSRRGRLPRRCQFS